MKIVIKTISISLSLLLLISCSKKVDEKNNENPNYTSFNKIKITDIHPKGWIKEFLVRQKKGLTGHIEVAGYPYNTKMWATDKIKGSTKAWWPYEQTGYYIDGVNRLGYLLNDANLKDRANIQTQYVLDHINPETSRVSTILEDRWKRWPYAGFFRNYMTNYEVTNDRSIVDALHKHYLTFEAKDFSDDLELANVEELCWLYGITKDEKMLEMAEEAYRIFKSDIENRNRAGADIQFGAQRKPDHHVVVYLELVKIPAILYSHTGKQEYLDEALNGIKKAEELNMLASGLPSSTEHFTGISELSGSETCNTAVFPHSYGYFLRITGDAGLGDKIEKAVFNAGLGSVTKDFKSHQYFTAPNQFLATLNSNDYGHHPSRMAYLPGHDVECCTGNVNRFMPYYVEQMWMTTPNNGLVASLFGPTSVTTKVGENSTDITVTENTNYPFSDTIEFNFQMESSTEFPFLIRIPEWSNHTKITVNDEVLEGKITPGSFFTIDRKFSNNDVVSLHMPMEVTTSTWPNNGISVERGPLVYSLPIDETTNIVSEYERATKEFPAIERRPYSDWNYGLNLSEGESPAIEIIETSTTGYPWDTGNSPIQIRVPAKKITNWKLKKVADKKTKTSFLTTPEFPKEIDTEGKTEYINLVPYGTTQLRLTVFPEVISKDITGVLKKYPNFKSKFVEPRNVDIWLPPSYFDSKDKEYPVLYMHDGQVLFQKGRGFSGEEWEVDEMMTKLIKEGKIKETIVIGIWNTVKRFREYQPNKPFLNLNSDEKKIRKQLNAEYNGGPLADEYLKFIIEELKPFIDTKFRTLADKQNTYMLGSSMGGLISIYAMAEYPDVFQKVACLSSHFPVSLKQNNPKIPALIISYLKGKLSNSTNNEIYFDYGSETLDSWYKPYQKQMDSVMQEIGYDKTNWITKKFEGANHSEAAWRERLEIPLTFLLRK
jgi:predicted alpha/beta superfamily hydrolase